MTISLCIKSLAKLPFYFKKFNDKLYDKLISADFVVNCLYLKSIIFENCMDSADLSSLSHDPS